MRNQIVAENALPGTSAWQLVNPAEAESRGTRPRPASPRRANLAPRQIDGTSIRGQVYRLGWYDGMGGRELAVLPEVERKPSPNRAWTGAAGPVRWEATYTIDVEADWVSGLYVVRLETVYDDGPSLGGQLHHIRRP